MGLRGRHPQLLRAGNFFAGFAVEITLQRLGLGFTETWRPPWYGVASAFLGHRSSRDMLTN